MKRMFGFISLALCLVFLFTVISCSEKDPVAPANETSISGVITSSPSVSAKVQDDIGMFCSSEILAGTPLKNAVVELYDADHLEWLYPVATTTTDANGNYELKELANAAENGDAYRNNNPIPAGNYTIIAHLYDVNTGTLTVAIQPFVKEFKGKVTGHNLMAQESDTVPSVRYIFGLPANPDGTFGGATNFLAENAALQISFGTPMARLTTLAAAGIKNASLDPVDGTWKLSPDLRSATFYPSSPWIDGQTYTITIAAGTAKDLYGNSLPATITGSFTAAPEDKSAPEVVTIHPAETAGVPVMTSILIASNEHLDVNTFSIEASPGIGVKPAISFAGKTGPVTHPFVYEIIPAGQLQYGTSYSITVSDALDMAGNPITPFSFEFSTEAAPTVVATSPADGEELVDVNSTVQATFSAVMDNATIESPAGAFTIAGVTGTVIYDRATRTAIFTPDAPFDYETTYTASITTQANDCSGAPATTYSWSFTTKSAQPSGSLDQTFGDNGIKYITIGSGGAQINSIAIQADGKIIAGGSAYSGCCLQFTLARFNVDGTLDTSFNSNGIVMTIINAGSASSIAAVSIQSDGKIVAAGAAPGGVGLVRYNADGSLDTEFGNGGIVTTTAVSGAMALGLQKGGKIVVAGGYSDIFVYRYNANGSLDASFNGTGMAQSNIGTWEAARALAIQTDGKIVVGGYSDVGQNRNFIVARYTADGSLDSSFGTGGSSTTNLGYSEINTLAMQSDGKIVAGGFQANGNYWKTALARYNTDGALDSTFGINGTVLTEVGNWRSEAKALVILPFGKILVAGYSGTTTTPTDFMVMRYTANGELDTTFNSDGIVLTDFDSDNDAASAVAVQADGKIVAAGSAFVSPATGFALARYWP